MATFRYPQTQTSITGGATEAKQDDIILELQQIEADIEAGNAAQATATNQTTGNASLSSIDGKITTVDTDNVTVSSSVLPTGAATETTLSTLDAKVTAVDTGNVTVSSSALPTGAATESTLSTLDAKVTAVDTGNVTVSSSVLPTGGATSANQTTANASLSNIEADIDSLNARLAGNLVPETFDYIALTYVAAGNGVGEIETVTYRTGGAAGSIVATLTLAYDASNRLANVTRS